MLTCTADLFAQVGDYEQGGLWTQDQGEVDCKHEWCLFDGNIPHCTLPYT